MVIHYNPNDSKICTDKYLNQDIKAVYATMEIPDLRNPITEVLSDETKAMESKTIVFNEEPIDKSKFNLLNSKEPSKDYPSYDIIINTKPISTKTCHDINSPDISINDLVNTYGSMYEKENDFDGYMLLVHSKMLIPTPKSAIYFGNRGIIFNEKTNIEPIKLNKPITSIKLINAPVNVVVYINGNRFSKESEYTINFAQPISNINITLASIDGDMKHVNFIAFECR